MKSVRYLPPPTLPTLRSFYNSDTATPTAGRFRCT
jgi:hypothetical protein